MINPEDTRYLQSSQPGWEDYARAESFLPWNVDKLISRLGVDPNWIDGSDRFWYRIQTTDGFEFVLVDPESSARNPAFDHVRLAASLARASGKSVTHTHLPFSEITFQDDGTAIQFQTGDDTFRCDLTSYECERVDPVASGSILELASPDGEKIAYAKDHNLYVRSGDGEGVALTDDGEARNAYATPLSSPLLDADLAQPKYFQFPIDELYPSAIWSPDSARIITHRLDERDVGRYHLVQSVPLNGEMRQRHFSLTYSLPGEENVPRAELTIIDVAGGTKIDVDVPPLEQLFFGSPLKRKAGEMSSDYVWWSDDSQRVYVLRKDRGFFTLALYVVDAATGESKLLIEESSETPIDPHLTSAGTPNVRVTRDGAEVLWFSQRDGWGHLYLYDGETGDLKRQLTSGAWAVADVLHVDDEARVVYFTGVGREAGRDVYMSHLYRVSLDGGDVELLTPEDADHLLNFAPSGRYFVDTYSTVAEPPLSVLRDVDGSLICELERASIDALLATGWKAPERFCVKGRDGQTDIYGVIYRPSNFDASRSYPVLDSIYGGPQVNQAPASFADISRGRRGGNFWHAQALAELGFIVVMIDGMGMPYRSKAYHDVSYRNLGDAGLPDHIAALRHLATRYPYLDLERVGIFGHSGGGYASCRALFAHPDFYKVAVSSAGNHDDALYAPGWTERYQGYPPGETYETQANKYLAHNLTGKLFLVHGEMDENVHLVSTLVVVDALIKANKSFDMMVMPNRIHSMVDDPYFTRIRWDYFVRHLLGAEPPDGYQIQPGPQEAAVDWAALNAELK